MRQGFGVMLDRLSPPRKPRFHLALHQVVHLVGGQAQQVGGLGLDLSGPQDPHRKAGKGEGEAGVGRSPGYAHRLDPVGGTRYPRQTGDQPGLKSAVVQMPPGPLFPCVIAGTRLLADGTVPLGVCMGNHAHAHLALLGVHFHGGDFPGVRQPQQLVVKFKVAHTPVLPTTHTFSRSARKHERAKTR